MLQYWERSVVTWGHPKYGGDSSAVQDQLKNVQQIQSTTGEFAAILVDGSVIAWGSPISGGDSSRVQGQLRNVYQIQATNGVGIADPGAFAAILADGSVIAWGSPEHGQTILVCFSVRRSRSVPSSKVDRIT